MCAVRGPHNALALRDVCLPGFVCVCTSSTFVQSTHRSMTLERQQSTNSDIVLCVTQNTHTHTHSVARNPSDFTLLSASIITSTLYLNVNICTARRFCSPPHTHIRRQRVRFVPQHTGRTIFERLLAERRKIKSFNVYIRWI